jgi:hypothetical protein
MSEFAVYLRQLRADRGLCVRELATLAHYRRRHLVERGGVGERPQRPLRVGRLVDDPLRALGRDGARRDCVRADPDGALLDRDVTGERIDAALRRVVGAKPAVAGAAVYG